MLVEIALILYMPPLGGGSEFAECVGGNCTLILCQCWEVGRSSRSVLAETALLYYVSAGRWEGVRGVCWWKLHSYMSEVIQDQYCMGTKSIKIFKLRREFLITVSLHW